MFASLKSKWLYFWNNHVQKTMGWLSAGLLGLDLSGYSEPIKGLIGTKGYYGVLLGSALITTARAHMVKKPDAPPPAA